MSELCTVVADHVIKGLKELAINRARTRRDSAIASRRFHTGKDSQGSINVAGLVSQQECHTPLPGV